MGIALFTLYVYFDVSFVAPSIVADYYIEHFLNDTFAENGVAAVYLNYRVFDTIFETLILLISVSAVKIFSWRRDHDE
jgi:multisubunit Na+/H+ antiporter MnhB subunit